MFSGGREKLHWEQMGETAVHVNLLRCQKVS